MSEHDNLQDADGDNLNETPQENSTTEQPTTSEESTTTSEKELEPVIISKKGLSEETPKEEGCNCNYIPNENQGNQTGFLLVVLGLITQLRRRQ